MQGYPPYLGKKNVYYQDKIFTSRMAEMPAFTTREEAVKIARETIEKYKQRRWFTVDTPPKENAPEDVPEDVNEENIAVPGDVQEDMGL
jgi:hypothetical protein